VRLIVSALAAVVIGAGLAAAAPAPADAAPAVRCWPIGHGHTMCRIWQYRCPGEPFPPLSQGAVPLCKRPGVYPVKFWRLVRY